VPGQSPTPLPLPMLPSNGHPANGVAQEPARPVPLRVGDPAPALVLPDLTGTPVHLADFQGHPMLVLFWNPGCGFCQRMLDDLKAWEAHPPKHAPQLLVVSTGTVADNQALGLRSRVVLDQGFTVGRTFGATGTPMAVLVDAEGRIASEMAAGAPAVLALAAQSPLQLKLLQT
jgi:thiol-disulfide isomerase/thioredoxin